MLGVSTAGAATEEGDMGTIYSSHGVREEISGDIASVSIGNHGPRGVYTPVFTMSLRVPNSNDGAREVAARAGSVLRAYALRGEQITAESIRREAERIACRHVVLAAPTMSDAPRRFVFDGRWHEC